MKSSIGRISEHLLRELKDTPHGLTWQNFWTTSVSAIFLLAVLIQVASAQQARTSKVTVENASDYAAEIQMKDSNPGQYQTVGQIFPGQKGTFSINVGSEWRYIFETPDGRVNEDYVVKNQPFQTWTLTAKTNTRPTPPGPIGGKKDSSQTTAINGHNLTSVDVYFGATKTGVIRQKSPGQWEWVEGEQNHPWREVRRTDTSVFLTDQESYIELNILRGGIFGSDNRFQTGDRYYLLKNPVAGNTAPPLPSSNVTGRNVTFVEKYTADTLAGRFRQLDGNSWREESALNSDTRDWTEVRRDENSVYLSSGGQIVQIDVKTPGIFVSQDNFQSRFQIYDVRNAKADAQSHPIDRSAQVILNNVGNQPLTIVEQNGKALKNFGDLAAGSRKTFDTIMGRILVVKGPDGSELTRIDVDSPLQARSLAMSSPPMPTDRTSTTPNLAKWYQIKHVQTGAVLDVPASSEENGVQIGVYANFDTPNQQFRFQQASNGHYFLVNRNSGKGVAAENISAQAGAKVVQYENGPGENDQFRIQSASGQNVYLIFKHSNKPLAIVDNTAIQGATLDRSAEFQLIAVADFKVGPNPPHDGGGDKMPPHSEDQGAGFTVNYFELWEQGSELYLTFRETNQTKWQSETTFGGKSSKWSVAKKEQDSIWLKHDVYNDSFEVNFLTGEVNLHADGVLVVKSRNLRLKNDKHRESTPGDDSIASFDPEWYDTPDQRKFRGLFANKRPGADSWGNAPRQVPNMQTNYSTTFYLPEMHPYRFGMEHCGCDEPLPPFAEISFDSQDFVSEIGGYSYPKTFFFTSEGTRGGKLERVGQIFFSETERQEAFAASASVEASGWGVSVGLSGDYGQGKSTTDSTENASVVITSHAGRY
ncbi:MAG: RICIN domain-containing protein, partial [Planctomycetaceae bacterium]|nr:RICIN domain-containing protein [Planctomycetaceae bacterium]